MRILHSFSPDSGFRSRRNLAKGEPNLPARLSGQSFEGGMRAFHKALKGMWRLETSSTTPALTVHQSMKALFVSGSAPERSGRTQMENIKRELKSTPRRAGPGNPVDSANRRAMKVAARTTPPQRTAGEERAHSHVLGVPISPMFSANRYPPKSGRRVRRLI